MEKINSVYDRPWIAVTDCVPEPEVFVLCWDGKETFVEWFGSKPDAGRGVTHWMPYQMPPGATSDMHDGRRAFAALTQPTTVQQARELTEDQIRDGFRDYDKELVARHRTAWQIWRDASVWAIKTAPTAAPGDAG